MGQYHPHGDTAIYDTLVRLGQPWSLRYPLVQGQGNFGSPGDDRQAAMRYTECRLAPLAMEMVRDIDEETVDFSPNYDGRQPSRTCCRRASRTCSSTAPAGSRSAWPPTSRRTTCARSRPACSGTSTTPRPSHEELLDALLERVKGPGLPDQGPDRRHRGIEEAYRTGRGSVTMRAVVEVEEDARGRTMLVISELPYQVNPDTLARKIAELADSGKV